MSQDKIKGAVTDWLCGGLQIRLGWFDSSPRLHPSYGRPLAPRNARFSFQIISYESTHGPIGYSPGRLLKRRRRQGVQPPFSTPGLPTNYLKAPRASSYSASKGKSKKSQIAMLILCSICDDINNIAMRQPKASSYIFIHYLHHQFNKTDLRGIQIISYFSIYLYV